MRDWWTIQVGVASLASKLSESKGWHRSQLAAEQFAKKEQVKLDGKAPASIKVSNCCYITSTSHVRKLSTGFWDASAGVWVISKQHSYHRISWYFTYSYTFLLHAVEVQTLNRKDRWWCCDCESKIWYASSSSSSSSSSWFPSMHQAEQWRPYRSPSSNAMGAAQ